MRSHITRLLGPIGLAGASVGLCLMGAAMAFYGPGLQRIGVSATSRLSVDYSVEQQTPRFGRVSASIIAAARADEVSLAGGVPDTSNPLVTISRPQPTSTVAGDDDGGPIDPPTPSPTRTPAPPARPSPPPFGGTVIEVPTATLPDPPVEASPYEPVGTATPVPTGTATRTPTATATVATTTTATPSATAAPSSTTTAVPTATVTAAPIKPGNPKPPKTPGPKKDPPGQQNGPQTNDPLPDPIDFPDHAGPVGHGAVVPLTASEFHAPNRRWRISSRAGRSLSAPQSSARHPADEPAPCLRQLAGGTARSCAVRPVAHLFAQARSHLALRPTPSRPGEWTHHQPAG